MYKSTNLAERFRHTRHLGLWVRYVKFRIRLVDPPDVEYVQNESSGQRESHNFSLKGQIVRSFPPCWLLPAPFTQCSKNSRAP